MGCDDFLKCYKITNISKRKHILTLKKKKKENNFATQHCRKKSFNLVTRLCPYGNTARICQQVSILTFSKFPLGEVQAARGWAGGRVPPGRCRGVTRGSEVVLLPRAAGVTPGWGRGHPHFPGDLCNASGMGGWGLVGPAGCVLLGRCCGAVSHGGFLAPIGTTASIAALISPSTGQASFPSLPGRAAP